MSTAQPSSQDADIRLSAMLQTDGLPGVLIANRPARDLSRDAITHLARAKTPLYVRHGQLVRVQRKEDGTPYIETLTDTTLKGVLMRAMNFVKTTPKGPIHVTPPDAIVKDLLTIGAWPFPPLDSIIEYPVFRPDGTLIDTPGYDAATRLLYMPLPDLKIPPVPPYPDDEAIVNALALIDEVIGEFPYQNEASKANAIGLLLTPIIRQSISGQVPLALLDATRPGTGKSLFAEAIAMTATGRRAAMMTAPYGDDEWRKRIASTLAEGATIIVIDNVKARLQAPSLDSALTSSVVKERVLGQSKNGVYAQRATWIATGNNIQLGGDLPRRSYWIRLDAHSDKPWTRGGFTHDLETWIPAHRGELIAALLTLARAWFAAGRPQAEVPRMGNFQSWADTIGGILAHTGIVEGFLGNLDALYEQADDDATQWAAFLHAWHGLYDDDKILVAKLVKDINAGSFNDGNALVPGDIGVSDLYNALPDEFTDVKKESFRKQLGKALASRVGTHFDESGLHLVRAGSEKRSSAIYWQVVKDLSYTNENAGLQVSQADFTLKEEKIPSYTPLEGMGGGVTGIFPLEKNLTSAVSKPAKPANLQEVPAWIEASEAIDSEGKRWHMFRLFDSVQTPQGKGVIVLNWLARVGVLLDGASEPVYYTQQEDIFQIKNLSRADGEGTEIDAFIWPYNDPKWTDEQLLANGYPTRTMCGFPYPEGYIPESRRIEVRARLAEQHYGAGKES